jgi:hypothetical protein
MRARRVKRSSDGTTSPEELNLRYIKGVKPLHFPGADLKWNLERMTFEASQAL